MYTNCMINFNVHDSFSLYMLTPNLQAIPHAESGPNGRK